MGNMLNFNKSCWEFMQKSLAKKLGLSKTIKVPKRQAEELTLIRLGFLKVIFSGRGSIWPPSPLHISRIINPFPIYFIRLLQDLYKVGWKLKKCWDHVICDVISLVATRKCQKIKKLLKINNIDEENLHIFCTTWGISVILSGKMCLMIILKVTNRRALPPL